MKELVKYYIEEGIDYFMHDSAKNRFSNHQAQAKPEEKGARILSSKSDELKGDLMNVSRRIASQCNSTDELRDAVQSFDGLEIKKYATNTVFSDGNKNSDIMLVGEAPGATEDQEGIPFCGRSGQLLRKILAAINLNEDHYYITNTVFWRPPANRRPTKEEIDICRPFVEKHISFIDPKIIILVGSTAVEALLSLKTSMAELRGEKFEYTNQYINHKIDTFVIFHPAYLLRQPAQKKLMWHDIQKINEFYLDLKRRG